MYDQCVYVLYFQVADAVHGVLYVLSRPKLTTVVEPSPYWLTPPLVMEHSVTIAAVWCCLLLPCGVILLLLCGIGLLLSTMWHCFTAAVWRSFTVAMWRSFTTAV